MENKEDFKIYEKLDEINNSLIELHNKTFRRQETSELNELFGALSKAQSEFKVAKNNNPNFFKSKYADLGSVIEASREALCKNGLCVIQRILTNGNREMYLYTRLSHSSGQWIESKMPINPPKDDIQSIGSYITYLKRYNYSAMVGVVSSDEDDDGEAAMKENRNKNEPKKDKRRDLITKDQLKILSNELSLEDELMENILKGYKINKLSDMPASEFFKCLEGIKIKKKKPEKEIQEDLF